MPGTHWAPCCSLNRSCTLLSMTFVLGAQLPGGSLHFIQASASVSLPLTSSSEVQLPLPFKSKVLPLCPIVLFQFSSSITCQYISLNICTYCQSALLECQLREIRHLPISFTVEFPKPVIWHKFHTINIC